MWLTRELFAFLPRIDDEKGAIPAYQLTVGTNKFPVGVIPYVAHRSHAVPASIHIAVEGGHWWLSFAAKDAEVTLPEHTADAATESIAEDLRHSIPTACQHDAPFPGGRLSDCRDGRPQRPLTPDALYFYNPALTTSAWMSQLVNCVT